MKEWLLTTAGLRFMQVVMVVVAIANLIAFVMTDNYWSAAAFLVSFISVGVNEETIRINKTIERMRRETKELQRIIEEIEEKNK